MNGVWLLVFVGCVLIAWGGWALWAYAPSRWVQVPATVLESEPVITPSNTGQLFVPRVRYAYVVNGRRYECERYAYSRAEDRGGRQEVEALLQAFPVGATVVAWHRVDRPGHASLKPASPYSRSQMRAQVVGGVLVLGLGVLVMALKRA